MRKILVMGLMLLAGVGLASAQDTAAGHGQGWALAGIGGIARRGADPVFQLGAGGEARLPLGFGAGAELGYMSSIRNLGNGSGLFTAGAFYHFPTQQKLVPFVTAGYGNLFSDGNAHAMYYGGGADYWFHDSLGLRFEVRDHYVADFTNIHIVGFRIGLSFR